MFRNLMLRILSITLVAAISAAPSVAQGGPVTTPTFHNPLKSVGPDPWVTSRDGFYYYMNSTGSNLTIWKTRDVTDLANAQQKIVWTPPATGPYSHELWAPELHFLQGKWYIYFAADEGSNESHRIFALENSSSDPLQGKWTFKGKVADPSDKWAIDASVFENHSELYMIWSGWEGDVNGVQSIYIARLSNPWTVVSKRTRLSTPQYPWEKVGDLDRDHIIAVPHVDVNEGPEVLEHEDKLFLVYSASGCWTNYYELGMLVASKASDLLNPSSWKKSAKPVFWQNPAGFAYGTGHNGFFKSPDGTQDWIIYHANPGSNQGCGNQRSPRAQPIQWTPDGMPIFGRPIPLGQAIPKPSGTG
jgi:GH43 family beta-xylosidase